MTDCPSPGALVEAEIDRVLTQYRESPNLLGMIRAYLAQVEEAILATCSIPSHFDLDTAVGDQLTLLGKRLGFPRCHCVCTTEPVFGFSCDGDSAGGYDIAGFCEGGTWLSCRETGTSTICIDDDDVYRRLLKARRFQARGLYDIASLQAAADEIWGLPGGDEVSIVPFAFGSLMLEPLEDEVPDRHPSVHSLANGRVAIAPNRVLAPEEIDMLPIAFRVLPIAPGIRPTVALVTDDTAPVFGFGEGWGGFCEASAWLCVTDVNVYTC